MECVLFFVGSGPKKSDMFGDDGTKETLLPVMYDVHRRLHLMRATKAQRDAPRLWQALSGDLGK